MIAGFVGVGAMGEAMARHAAKSGFDVEVFDADQEVMDRLKASGLTVASSLADLGKKADTIIIMVATDSQCESVVDTLLASGVKDGAVLVVSATTHPKTMVELSARCEKQGVGFVDAPVCYGMQGAKNGNLISLCGGRKSDIDKVYPILMSYSRSVEHIGDVGCGQIAKTCNNMMHWAACVANYETLALARACGINAQSMRETLLKCPARNTTLERWDTTRFTWHEKDMDVALDLAQKADLPLPLFGAVDQLVKLLGPEMVKSLLHGGPAHYLGKEIVEIHQ